MGVLDVLGASRGICDGVAAIATAYRTNPGREVTAAKLPATIQEMAPGSDSVEFNWSASQDDRRYTFNIHVLYNRDGDLVDEEEEAITLAEAVVEAFKALPGSARALGIMTIEPTAMSKPFASSIFEHSYTVVTLTMFAKQKVPATFS